MKDSTEIVAIILLVAVVMIVAAVVWWAFGEFLLWLTATFDYEINRTLFRTAWVASAGAAILFGFMVSSRKE